MATKRSEKLNFVRVHVSKVLNGVIVDCSETGESVFEHPSKDRIMNIVSGLLDDAFTKMGLKAEPEFKPVSAQTGQVLNTVQAAAPAPKKRVRSRAKKA